MNDALYVPLAEGDLKLEPLAETHREGLRAATAADAEIWRVYPVSYKGTDFDPQFDRLLAAAPVRRPYAILERGRVVGMTAWIERGEPGWAIEIGNSYIMPETRGTGLNRRIKRLMLDHAFHRCGLTRVEFRVDERNARSQAAVLRLGAVREGVLRAERVTWTGHVRDTVVFSILAGEWPHRSGD
ncbi:MAG TPA: GNAT family protein [Sphingomonadaceae bacterium]|nr:GNAT family protein [Sphingomonadaceae bacterium]